MRMRKRGKIIINLNIIQTIIEQIISLTEYNQNMTIFQYDMTEINRWELSYGSSLINSKDIILRFL